MKKILWVLIFFTAFCFDLFSNDNFSVDISTEFGAMTGQVKEYVFVSPVSDTEYVLSRLDWDVNFIRFMGLSLDMFFLRHFYIGLAGRAGFPSASGSMQDYDWLNVNVLNRTDEWYSEHYWLTNYSKHENYLNSYANGLFRIGALIPLSAGFSLLPFFAVQGEYFYFSGENGYYQYVKNKNPDGSYEKWSDDIEPGEFSGRVISYDQLRMFTFVGLRLTAQIPHFYFSVEGNFSPFTFITAIDTHEKRNLAFKDLPFGFGSWNVSGRIQFKFNEFFNLGLNVEYQQVPVLKGYDYYKSTTSKTWNYDPSCLGGTSSKLFSFSVVATIFH